MKAIACLAALAIIAMVGTAMAQTKTIKHHFTVKQGATVPIGSYYLINKRTCHAGPIPQIVQTSNPTISKLIIEQTKVEPTQKQCRGFLIPGYLVRFEAGNKAGEEKITYKVIYQKGVGTTLVEDTVTVQ
jgi:hypothetical protein